MFPAYRQELLDDSRNVQKILGLVENTLEKAFLARLFETQMFAGLARPCFYFGRYRANF